MIMYKKKFLKNKIYKMGFSSHISKHDLVLMIKTILQMLLEHSQPS